MPFIFLFDQNTSINLLPYGDNPNDNKKPKDNKIGASGAVQNMQADGKIASISKTNCIDIYCV